MYVAFCILKPTGPYMLPVTCCLGISPWDMGLGTHNLTTYSCTHSIHHPVTCKQQAPQPKGQGTKRYGFTRKEHVCMHTCVCIRSCSRNVRVQHDIVSQSNWHIWHTHTPDSQCTATAASTTTATTTYKLEIAAHAIVLMLFLQTLHAGVWPH